MYPKDDSSRCTDSRTLCGSMPRWRSSLVRAPPPSLPRYIAVIAVALPSIAVHHSRRCVAVVATHHHPLLLIPSLVGCCVVFRRLLSSSHAIMRPSTLSMPAAFAANCRPPPPPPPPLQLPLLPGRHHRHRHHLGRTHRRTLTKKEAAAAPPPPFQLPFRLLAASAGCRIASHHPFVAPPSRHLIVLDGCCVDSRCAAVSSTHCAALLAIERPPHRRHCTPSSPSTAATAATATCVVKRFTLVH